ncbi:MAG TPA: PEPxxWA-CTERM sorting domain-containing protein [Phenylobacterium sp.]
MAGQAAAADIFTLQTTNGGDGGITPMPTGFEVFGADNGLAKFGSGQPASSLTSYTATAGADEILTFNWTSSTNDLSGPSFDPTGYLLNGTQHQLSSNSLDPFAPPVSGSLTLSLTAGDSYGFYVFSGDSQEGRGRLRIETALFAGEADPPAAAPEPATWALMLSGFFGLGLALRRRRVMAAGA